MTPLEKAARAVWDAREARNPIQFTRMSWETGTPLAKALLVEDIRTALMALREPDDMLLQPGCAKHTPGKPMSERYPEECPTFIRRRRVWKEQIDHILKGGETQPPNDGEPG